MTPEQMEKFVNEAACGTLQHAQMRMALCDYLGEVWWWCEGANRYNEELDEKMLEDIHGKLNFCLQMIQGMKNLHREKAHA